MTYVNLKASIRDKNILYSFIYDVYLIIIVVIVILFGAGCVVGGGGGGGGRPAFLGNQLLQ